MVRASVLALLGAVAALPVPQAAAEGVVCLTRREQKAAIENGRAVTLAAAMRAAHVTVRGRNGREVVKARLCRTPEGLRYLLTVLSRDGKVTRTAVDATSGKVVEVR